MHFIYPGFLWGLLAVVIPMTIHLLQLRRPQRLLFTNIDFIQEVELTTMRRRRIQEILVLLLRVLGIIFLVLIFAQPFLPAQQATESGNEVAVLLDNSSSMQGVGSTQQSLLQEAETQAEAMGKGYGAATRFHIIGQPGGVLTQAAYLTKVAEIANRGNQPGWDGAAIRQQLQRKERGPLYVFSDFQRSGQSKAALQTIAANREITLVPQIARPAANVYVDSVWLDDAFVRTQTNIGLHIRLRNGGVAATTDCPVKVRLGRQQVAAFKVALGAGQATTTLVQIRLAASSLVLGEVLVEDSPVTFDNTYYFTLQPTAAIRVLEISAEPLTRQVYNTEALFAYSFEKPKLVNYSDLRQANLVLVREVTEVDAGLREALVAAVRRGATVVVVPPGGGVGRDATLQLLRALGIGGVQWEPAATSTPNLREIAIPNPRDPFFREVFGAQARQVVMPQVAPVPRLGRGGTDILRLRDGDSYLTEYGGVGKGHAYIFTAPFAKAYGDFTAQGLFVPVLYRLAMLSYHTNQRPAYRLTEPTLTLEVPPATDPSAEAEFRLVRDSLALIPAQRLRGTSLQLDVPAGLGQPGFYELRRHGQTVTTLAFNTNRRESELATYSAAELRQLIGPGHPNVQVLDGAAGPEALARYRAGQTGQALWRYCLLVVLACLLAEGLLLRFGRPAAGARPTVAA